LSTLGKCSKINIIKDESEVPKGCGLANIGTSKIFLELGKYVDVNKEIERLNKKLAEIREFKERLETKMKDKNRDKMP
jgi:valyl-tRNA synthetase